MQFHDNLSFMMTGTKRRSQNPVRLEDTISQTNLVAIVRQEFAEIDRLKDVTFRSGFDDLDYLVFATLSLPSGNCVGLVRHNNSPSPGIEICVSYNQLNTREVLKEALIEMNLTPKDLTWIHPEYQLQ